MNAPSTVDAADVSTPGRRIAELDVLRGFALCGILVVNILQQLVGRPFPPAIDLLFVERFLSLFALLFGVGFGLFLDRAATRTARPRVVLARRLGVLLLIGIAHQFLQPGEALVPYALVGLVLLLPMSILAPRACLVVALVLLLVAPQVQQSYGLTVALLALGFALARLGLPSALGRHPGRTAVVLAVAGTLDLAWALAVTAGWTPPQVNVLGGGLGGAQSLLPPLAALTTAVAYAAALLLLLRTPVGAVIGRVIAPMGRMALTNYLTATVLFVTLGPALGIDSLDDGAAIAGLTVGILVVQAVWSSWWLRRFRYGPVEWLWRCLTWWQRAPIMK
ncbi:putative membrane protein YeiB [Actinomycetospora succinea]|uniref:Putative membrane protein YeiB n=1 Tax=Actinomycetospora succinea TaxID=663603 RepID=A0A4R6VMF4_9PSEU|nr:DUF418 domain-containing protein [Actinomycetospora succinea]TDQ63119.1 putative membrane protein YeiB [Actinomycetospora succinea]